MSKRDVNRRSGRTSQRTKDRRTSRIPRIRSKHRSRGRGTASHHSHTGRTCPPSRASDSHSRSRSDIRQTSRVDVNPLRRRLNRVIRCEKKLLRLNRQYGCDLKCIKMRLHRAVEAITASLRSITQRRSTNDCVGQVRERKKKTKRATPPRVRKPRIRKRKRKRKTSTNTTSTREPLDEYIVCRAAAQQQQQETSQDALATVATSDAIILDLSDLTPSEPMTTSAAAANSTLSTPAAPSAPSSLLAPLLARPWRPLRTYRDRPAPSSSTLNDINSHINPSRSSTTTATMTTTMRAPPHASAISRMERVMGDGIPTEGFACVR